ncbi:unnamed protein product, partial [Vitis vinifera]
MAMHNHVIFISPYTQVSYPMQTYPFLHYLSLSTPSPQTHSNSSPLTLMRSLRTLTSSLLNSCLIPTAHISITLPPFITPTHQTHSTYAAATTIASTSNPSIHASFPTPILHKSAPQVALFSARGPNIRDFNFQDVDLLKLDILAPGSLIWAAWSPNGTDEANYVGEGFAMVSGTSMAAPHIAGIAALQKDRHWD